MAPKVCPRCQRPLPPEIEIRGSVRQRIYDYVKRHPNGVTRQQIFDSVYADDPNGGPEHFSNVSTQVWFLNKTLKRHGLKIRSTRGRGAIYSLIKL